MRHPSEYTTMPMGGLHVMQVDPGTVIERTGETITVDDETTAVKGRVVFCTEKVFEALKTQAAPAGRGGADV